MSDYKVSICIPAYENGLYIKRLLESIKNQTYKNYEVILTDDSVENEVLDIVTDYKDIMVIEYYRNNERLGPTKNCNRAISLAKGEYIKVMHHDDWFANDKSLEKFVNMLEKNNDVSLAFSGTEQVSTERRYTRHIESEQVKKIQQDWRNLFLGNYIGAPSATIFKNEGWTFDENLKWCVDYELYMRILRNNSNFTYTEAPLICIGESETQVTQACMEDKKLRHDEYKYVYEKFELKHYPQFFKAYVIETLKYLL